MFMVLLSLLVVGILGCCPLRDSWYLRKPPLDANKKTECVIMQQSEDESRKTLYDQLKESKGMCSCFFFHEINLIVGHFY